MTQAQQLNALMSELSVGGPSASGKNDAASSATTTASSSRLKPVIMSRYCSPAFARPANTGLAARAADQAAQSAASSHLTASASSSTYNESVRGPLLKLAGINVAVPSNTASPGKPKQYVAHGVHGPAHGTSSRLGAMGPSAADAAIKAQGGHARMHAAAAGQGAAGQSKSGLGSYDGGFESDVRDREVPQGDAARTLEMESHKPG